MLSNCTAFLLGFFDTTVEDSEIGGREKRSGSLAATAEATHAKDKDQDDCNVAGLSIPSSVQQRQRIGAVVGT